MSNPDPNVARVSAFITRLLTGIVTEQSVSVGLADMPVLGALRSLKPGDYKQVMKTIASDPGAVAFASEILRSKMGK